jgi:hypothetical protein
MMGRTRQDWIKGLLDALANRVAMIVNTTTFPFLVLTGGDDLLLPYPYR